LIEADFHSEYHIDLSEPGLLKSRSWRWMKTRIAGLATAETRLQRKLAPPPETPDPKRR
jgi:hypothetical protein